MTKWQNFKNYLLIFFAGIGAALFAIFFRKKDNTFIKEYMDEKRKNYDLTIDSTRKRIMDVPLEGLLKPGEHVQEVKSEDEV